MPKYSFSGPGEFGRKHRYYQPGETRALYGIARQTEDGTYLFMNDYGNWGDTACTWTDPPYHYLKTQEGKMAHKDAFIVNFRKKNAPQPKYMR